MKEIHQQAFVIPVGQSVQSKNVLLRVPSDSDFTIMSSMGIKRQELQEGKRTQRLMMAVVPEFDVDAGNNYLMSSFVPNVSSLLLGSSDFGEYNTTIPLSIHIYIYISIYIPEPSAGITLSFMSCYVTSIYAQSTCMNVSTLIHNHSTHSIVKKLMYETN